MSPEEWAKKIRDLIDEAEIDLAGVYTHWYFEQRGFTNVLQRYENGYATDEYVEIW